MLKIDSLKEIAEKHILSCFYDNNDALNISRLIGLFDPVKMSRTLLFDLIELSHEMYLIIKDVQIFIKKKRSEGEEISLQLSSFLLGYAKTSVIKNYTLAFSLHLTNTPLINHCVETMFSLIVNEVELEEKLFHISILRVCSDILNNESISMKPQFKELIRFSEMLVESFLVACQKNDMLYIHCLFWQSSSQAAAIKNQTTYPEYEGEMEMKDDPEEEEYDFPERPEGEYFPKKSKRSVNGEKKARRSSNGEKIKSSKKKESSKKSSKKNAIDDIFSDEDEEEENFEEFEEVEKSQMEEDESETLESRELESTKQDDDDEVEYDFGASKENSNSENSDDKLNKIEESINAEDDEETEIDETPKVEISKPKVLKKRKRESSPSIEQSKVVKVSKETTPMRSREKPVMMETSTPSPSSTTPIRSRVKRSPVIVKEIPTMEVQLETSSTTPIRSRRKK
jgi:hypothetical protein